MLKKILSSLATLTLVAGSVTTTTAWTEHKNQNMGNTQKKNQQSSENYSLDKTNFTKNPSLLGKTIESVYSYNNIIYVGTFQNGLWQSTDNGKTFIQNKNIFVKSGEISAIYSYNNVLYVGGDSVLYESTDNGKTFFPNLSLLIFPYIGLITSIYAYNNVLYFGTDYTGLFESTDNGLIFTKNKTVHDSDDNTDLGFDVHNIFHGSQNTIYVSSYYGLYQSSDNGKTFTQNNWFKNNVSSTSYIYYYKNTLWVASNDGEYGGLYESTDNGKTFTRNNLINIYYIYCYKDFVYIGTTFGLYESFDNGKTFTIDESTNFWIFSIYAFNNVVYLGTEDSNGLLESNIYAYANPPDKIQNITNLGQTYGYLMYSNPINFSFDWTVLSKVTIVNNSASTPTTKTLTSGSYQIKDDGNYTVTFSFKDGTTAPYTQRFLLQNGYDFSQGLDMVTYDPATSMLDIYFKLNQAELNHLELNWYNHPEADPGLLLYWLNYHTIEKTKTFYRDLLSNDNLMNDIKNFIATPCPKPPKPSPKPKNPANPNATFNLLNRDITYPPIADETDYGYALQNKIKSLNPTKGLVLKLKIDQSRNITRSENPSLGELPLNPYCKEKEKTFPSTYYSNYWDQVLFNQN